MEQSEIEQQVGEAETSVERLRALYDQYFMGIERIEPQVARKDVERRIQMLRKTQIRNTALRFRFQNVLLRYNSFAAHWMRICRQIEEGTYKHHLRKAKDRFDPDTAARESREARRKAAALEYNDTEPPPANEPMFELNDDLGIDVDFDEGLDRPDARAALRSYAIPQDVMAPSVAGKALASMKAQPAASAPQARAAPREIEKGTIPAPPPDATAVTAKPPPPQPRPGPPPVPGAPARPPLAPPPLPPRAAGAAPATAAPAGRPPPPPPQAQARPAPSPGAASANVRPVPPRAPTAGAAPQASPAAAPRSPAVARPPQASDPSHLSDERVRQIYSKYVETRKSLKDSTAVISMDSMARSLRDSSAKLREKHAGKAVDFDVQVKDGKAVLKPIVR